ncbi:hypothetical protein [Hanstruepera marina]|uniref:hypothetical protein n=1 Tax=Hanstruepera marina TaxID=2873265 RepID=UPI001CA6AF99|nr:hypothetical protein [Hanstruepera marina]
MSLQNSSKSKKLIFGIVFDLLGYVSIIFPPFDIVWAPLSAYLMIKMYEGTPGKVAGVISFVEEALPFVDFIPSFSLMWLYTFVFTRKETDSEDLVEKKDDPQ